MVWSPVSLSGGKAWTSSGETFPFSGEVAICFLSKLIRVSVTNAMSRSMATFAQGQIAAAKAQCPRWEPSDVEAAHSRAAVQPGPRELLLLASARSRAEVPLAAQLREPELPVFVVSTAREADAVRMPPKRESAQAETVQVLASPVAVALGRGLAC